jgi:hypothetical protein
MHYEVEVTLRFEVNGPLACHEAVQAVAETRIAKALKGDGPAYSDPVKSAHIITVIVDDVNAGGARPASGGKR